MTTVVLAPSPHAAAAATAVVSSPTSSNNNNSPQQHINDSEDNNESSAREPEAEEKENEERNNNNNSEESERESLAAADASAKSAVMGKSVTAIEMRYKKRPRVSFESADIVEFEPTLYTTTVTSGGIPVGMSFTERSRSRRRLDSWELERTEVRVGRQSYMEEGYLDPTERESILNKTGYDDSTMVVVEAEVNRIIADRRESNEVDFEFMYGLGEVDDSLVEEEEEDDEEEEEEGGDGSGNQQQEQQSMDADDESDDDNEEDEEDGAEEASGRGAAGGESSSGFSSEEEVETDRTRA